MIVYASLFVKGEIFSEKFRLRVYVPFYRMKKFFQKKFGRDFRKNFEKNSEDGGCLEMGCVEGDGGFWMVKQGHGVEGLTVATLRDVRLFRCKRFEGILSAVGGIGTD